MTSSRSAEARLAKKMLVIVLSLRYRAMVNMINPVIHIIKKMYVCLCDDLLYCLNEAGSIVIHPFDDIDISAQPEPRGSLMCPIV